MKLQDTLKNVSTIPNAFSIDHFVKKDNDYYNFSSFQGFEYDSKYDSYLYTYNIYSSNSASKGSDIYEALKELANFIDNNLLADGSLDPKATMTTSQGTVNKGWTSSSIQEGIEEAVETIEEDPLYCSCKTPNISKSHAMGFTFDYCKTCMKERLANSLGKGSKDSDWYWY